MRRRICGRSFQSLRKHKRSPLHCVKKKRKLGRCNKILPVRCYPKKYLRGIFISLRKKRGENTRDLSTFMHIYISVAIKFLLTMSKLYIFFHFFLSRFTISSATNWAQSSKYLLQKKCQEDFQDCLQRKDD